MLFEFLSFGYLTVEICENLYNHYPKGKYGVELSDTAGQIFVTTIKMSAPDGPETRDRRVSAGKCQGGGAATQTAANTRKMALFPFGKRLCDGGGGGKAIRKLFDLRTKIFGKNNRNRLRAWFCGTGIEIGMKCKTGGGGGA